MVTPAAKREVVAHLKAQLGLSERRACQIAGADRKTIRYQSRRAPDTALRGRLRDLANERRRFGYPAIAATYACRREETLPLVWLGYFRNAALEQRPCQWSVHGAERSSLSST